MIHVQVWKSSLSQGGLLCNTYFADKTISRLLDFYEFAPLVVEFDMAFCGQQTIVQCVTATNANSGATVQELTGCVWASSHLVYHGTRPVPEPLPWRWTLAVGFYPARGKPHHHYYHDALDRSDVSWNSRGDVVLKWDNNAADVQNGRFGRRGGEWPDWLRCGSGTAKPGDYLSIVHPRQVLPCGVSVRNKARRHQALLLNQGLQLELKMVGVSTALGREIERLLEIQGGDVGGRVSGDLEDVTNRLMAGVVSGCQAHKENNRGKSGKDINDGNGWNVRFGPTGAAIAGKYNLFEDQLQQDQKLLKKFPAKFDVRGDKYFDHEDALQWYTVAESWGQKAGMFAFFDFRNPDQTDLQDDTKVDNYTPLHPDFQGKSNSPIIIRPKKDPKRKIPLPGLFS